MNPNAPQAELDEIHAPDRIQERLFEGPGKSYFADGVLGAVDGSVTTFAIVSGVIGGALPVETAVILGGAKLLADGFSMAVSNYQSSQSEAHVVDRARRVEEHHIKHVPEGEREEVRQIYQAKGFEGRLLEEIVDVICADEALWIETMITEEHGLSPDIPSPVKAGVVTFSAFMVAGAFPLLPFFFVASLGVLTAFWLSALLTGLSLFAIGVLRARLYHQNMLTSGLGLLFTGGGAAAVAWLVGSWLHSAYGVAA